MTALRSRPSSADTHLRLVDEPRVQRGWLTELQSLAELEIEFDETSGILWQNMRPIGRPSLTRSMLRDGFTFIDTVKRGHAEDVAEGRAPVRYAVLSSQMKGIFNLGGDLDLFVRLIRAGDADRLTDYAHRCVEWMHAYVHALDLPVHTIALVNGDALGGGWEMAMAQDTIIAERSAKFGLPEVLFNLFPGMGAYSLLSRRIDPIKAEQMILSGRLFSAEELREIGLVDIVAEDGRGDAALQEYIRRHEKNAISRQAVFAARRIARPLELQELRGIVDLWINAALSLGDNDLRKMERLVTAQQRRLTTPA
jgi:DSF synthase